MKENKQPLTGEPAVSGPDGKKGYYPPTGTYPSPQEAPALSGMPAPPAEKPRRVRRVGTLTMALCLIAAGVLLVLYVFLPGLNLLPLARLSPVVLVLLGAEILWANIRHGGGKMKYDILSIFICLVLIGGSLTVATVHRYVFRGEEAAVEQTRLEQELEQASRQALAENGGPQVGSVEWYVGLDGRYLPGLKAGDLRPEHTVQLRVSLEAAPAGAGAYAAGCRAVLDKLLPLVPHLDYASFYSASFEEQGARCRYVLWLADRYQIADTGLPLENLVEKEYWTDDGHYISEEEYLRRLDG